MERQGVRKAIKKYVPSAIRVTLLALALAIVVTAIGSMVFLLRDKPVIQGPEGDVVELYIGDNIAFRKLVSVREGYELSWDSGKLNRDKEGTYEVVYTATDEDGNETEYVLRVIMKKKPYLKEDLMEMIAKRAEQLGMKKSMSKTELVRRIYDYVNSPNKGIYEANILFNDESNTPNQRKQDDPSGIRTDWEVDWIEEAVRTLEMDRMAGDCYTYYSVSKAFFEYFKIENVGIQRAKGSGEPGTHFWSAVRVESGWYYYDATRLAGSFSDGGRNACLITEAKLKSYVSSEGGKNFYYFKKPSDFPRISTTPIN